MTRQWTATMIAPDADFAGAPLLRREVTLDSGHGDVAAATLHVTSCGIHEAFVGGRPVSEELFSPGWSSYEWRMRYRSHDVTALVRDQFVVGLALGNGWFRGRLGWGGRRALYGVELAGLAELEITFADGHVQRGGHRLHLAGGPVGDAGERPLHGQTIDARLASEAWLQPGAQLAGWTGVHPIAYDLGRLTPYISPVVTRHEVLRPVKVWTSPAGAHWSTSARTWSDGCGSR